MKRIVVSGKTVDEAVTSALVKLGVAKSQASVKVISEPVRGFLGFLGGKDAQVEISVQQLSEDDAKDFLLKLLKHMGVSCKLNSFSGTEENRGMIVIDVICNENDLPLVIGRHGSTLDSLQYLVNIVANHEQEQFTKFVIDAGDYRHRRKEGLFRMADRAAQRALRSKRPVSLDAMPSIDRKLLHTYLQQRSDVTTTSEGVDPNRKIVVVPIVQSATSRVMKAKYTEDTSKIVKF